MKKWVLLLIAVMVLFTETQAYAITGNSGSANKGFGYYVTDAKYLSDGKNLLVNGFFVNATKHTVTNVKTLRLTINGRDGFVVAQSVSGGGLNNLSLKPGCSKAYSVLLAKPNKGRDLSRIDYNVDCDLVNGKEIKLPEGIKVFYQGSMINYDIKPAVIAGRILIPARLTFEKMGATVSWNPSSKTVNVQRGSKQVEIGIDRNQMRINGVASNLEVSAKIIDGRTMIPLRAVATALDCVVNWGDEDKMVVIADAD